VRSKSLRFLAGLIAGLFLTLGILTSQQASESSGATDMSDDDRAMAARMHSFVRALFEPPTNEDPALQWSAVLTDGSLSCSVCHGSKGEAYDRLMEDGVLEGWSADSGSALSREKMVELMEDWVEQLNHDAGHLLRKAVVCTDCHDRDPRRG
jgi:hypothetical protein